MNVVRCEAPIGSLEPAPLTSLPMAFGDVDSCISAFWAADDSYLVRVGEAEAATWWCFEAPTADVATDESERRAMGAMLSGITAIGGGRIPFPVGSTGRTVFRVWRANGADRTGRTRILGVRAARSRRLPA
jgi:hypothetical protein